MGVEQDCWELRFEPRPRHDEDGLSGNHLSHVIVQTEPVGLDLQELDTSGIIRIRLYGFDPDIVPEQGYGRMFA